MKTKLRDEYFLGCKDLISVMSDLLPSYLISLTLFLSFAHVEASRRAMLRL